MQSANQVPLRPYPARGVRQCRRQYWDPEGLTLAEYLRSPARGYKDLRKLEVGGIQALATGPVNDDFGRFIDEQVYLLHRGKIYSITAYAVDGCPKEFERVLSTFEFTK